MEEVHSQLTPLKLTVERLDRTLRSLYSNGSGGPPGYLELARAEDKRTFSELFEKVEGIRPIEDFITRHEAYDKQREADRKAHAEALAEKVEKSERKFKRYIALWSLAIGVFMALIALWDHRDAIKHSLLETSNVHQIQNAD